MNDLKTHEFNVPIDEDAEGAVVILWPCDAEVLRGYVMKRFGLDPGDRNTWEGKCYFSQELDERVGRPFVVLALKSWNLNLLTPTHRESHSDKLALLAHECFHAAEWMLKQSGYLVPTMKPGGEWESWEDAAYLLQRIMRRALGELLKNWSSVTTTGQVTNPPTAECQIQGDD
jgi:hypothetical protein